MVKFRISFPPASLSDVSTLEKRIGHPLPESYRNFLLSYNGGLQPRRETFSIPGEGDSLIQVFFGFYEGYNNLGKAIERWEHVFPNAMPIARDLCGNYILLGLTGQHLGRVYWCDHDLLPDGSEADPVQIFETFSDFLACFDEDSP